ncbi:hypothetical protein [Actinoplanes sp. NPDC051494]|uniref:hypothetical protein n=1 Tax=Actinoplanes sp. NPDC051494 TaxID=3363907 RepID=UPI00379C654E
MRTCFSGVGSRSPRSTAKPPARVRGPGAITIHSANPAGAAKMAQVLRHWGYPVRIASHSPEVGYLGESSM